ncbi:MAG: 50S ribosomal protein L24 [Alphaproteobacteria bacterium]|jgi:large subunit ribosomal protein L24|tara:strand:- start:36736 stop:37053 length:318 start_codon:yes stop_codon:yes gene_type:complete
MAARIKKGDKVTILAGKDKGKTGEVLLVIPDRERVLVQGVNLVKRHQKQSATEEAGIKQKELSIHVSNVAIVDSETLKPTRIGFKFLDDGKKVRYAKKSGEVIDG